MKNVETKTKTANKSVAAETLKTVVAAKTTQEALDNVLLDVPKSAKKIVTDGTAFLMKSVMSSAHNAYACGETLSQIEESVSEASFGRLINEVWSRFGLYRVKINRWIKNFTVLAAAVTYSVARDALLTVSDGIGLVSNGKDGEAPTLAGGYLAGLKKFPVPKDGTSYEDCLDWAREVQIIAEKNRNIQGMTISDVYKAAQGKMDILLNGNRKLNGNLKLACEFVVVAYRKLNAKSAPIAVAALEAIEDDSISPDAAGTRAMQLLRDAERADKAAAQETAVKARKA